jgi:hypothetical protein
MIGTEKPPNPSMNCTPPKTEFSIIWVLGKSPQQVETEDVTTRRNLLFRAKLASFTLLAK